MPVCVSVCLSVCLSVCISTRHWGVLCGTLCLAAGILAVCLHAAMLMDGDALNWKIAILLFGKLGA